MGSLQLQSVGPLTIPTGTITINEIWSIAAPLGEVTIVSCTGNTNTTITVPTGATFVLIEPPSANGEALTFKGVSGDTGVPIDKTATTPFLVTQCSSFVIAVTGASAVVITFTWI